MLHSTRPTGSIHVPSPRRVTVDSLYASCSGVTHLRQDVDPLVAPSEGQVEHRAAAVGHGGRVQLQHQVRAVGLGLGGLGVLLWTHHVEGLQNRRETQWGK